MTTWDKDILAKIRKTDDLHVAPFRADGKTFGTLTWIWSVVVDEELFVRAYNGTNSRWYKAALAQKSGRITAAGMTLDVSFEQADAALNGKIDAAYRTKYSSSPYLNSMISDRARSATIKIIPQN
ncbi:MAG: DUF2255 family protein [Deferribacteres bacterium]|nr:DUF2255 family protein [candidate division KSB1 bacterium]MCB9504079.1 DUF2255 family protein [Deferribacteres bacterium]